jgi:hypothetical protein
MSFVSSIILKFLSDRLVTNVLHRYNDLSMITVLCTAEGMIDMWALLKLSRKFHMKLNKMGLPAEYAQAFQICSILHKLTLTYPTTNLTTFQFACTYLGFVSITFSTVTSQLT